MVSAKEMFANTDWLHHLQAIASECTELGSSIDMVIVGAYGKTSDEEKAVAMAVAMRKSGMVGNLSLVANRDNVVMRARLAKVARCPSPHHGGLESNQGPITPSRRG